MAIVIESIFRFAWHCRVITPKAELTDRLWGIIIRSGVEIMVVLSYPQHVSSIRSSGGRFSSLWGVHIRYINLLGTGLEIATLVKVLAWLFSRVSSCTRAAGALRLPRNMLTYWLLPWGNTRGGSAILPRTWFGIYCSNKASHFLVAFETDVWSLQGSYNDKKDCQHMSVCAPMVAWVWTCALWFDPYRNGLWLFFCHANKQMYRCIATSQETSFKEDKRRY